MKIIDRKTGKRAGKNDTEFSTHKKKLKEEDPIVVNANKEDNTNELSAMDPPDAYSDEYTLGANYNDSDAFIQELMDEHKIVIEKLKIFDEKLIQFRDSGFIFDRDISLAFNSFFEFFDEHILPHNQKEEKHFFRILHKKFIESGEHGIGEEPNTAIDIMEDDHVKFIQLAALSFNLLGLATRLRDAESRAMTFDLAFNSGRELVELLRLHIFREDETLFPLAQKLLTKEDFELINE